MNLIIIEKFRAASLFIEHGIDAVPFKHNDLETWRSNFKGIRYKSIEHNYDFGGAVDDICEIKW